MQARPTQLGMTSTLVSTGWPEIIPQIGITCALGVWVGLWNYRYSTTDKAQFVPPLSMVDDYTRYYDRQRRSSSKAFLIIVAIVSLFSGEPDRHHAPKPSFPDSPPSSRSRDYLEIGTDGGKLVIVRIK